MNKIKYYLVPSVLILLGFSILVFQIFIGHFQNTLGRNVCYGEYFDFYSKCSGQIFIVMVSWYVGIVNLLHQLRLQCCAEGL